MRERLSRREILKLLGAGVGATIAGAHCGGTSGDDAVGADDAALVATQRQMLKEIDHFVVLMQENRSFDHFMGALQRDKKYANRKDVNGTSGAEWNPAPGGGKVHIHQASSFKLEDPPHSIKKSHEQWDGGNNDKFVIAHEGDYQRQVMAYYDRSQIPFYYWLSDHFTLCDDWHASVMGPTTPNRLYLHCGTSAGNEVDEPLLSNEPKTIWEHLADKGKTGINYHAGRTVHIAHTLPNKADKITGAKIDELFTAAANGTLPDVSYVDPDFSVNCDHPNHDIRLGQAFVQSIYQALAKGPKWQKTLFIVCYDEHGGFYDHVSPGEAPDRYPDFRRFGFRVPAMIAGGMVKRGYLATRRFDHTSVLATLALRYDLGEITKRTSGAETLTHVLDPNRAGTTSASAPASTSDAPPPTVITPEAMRTIGPTSQPGLELSIARGILPKALVDDRSTEERTDTWLQRAEELGAVRYDYAAR